MKPARFRESKRGTEGVDNFAIWRSAALWHLLCQSVARPSAGGGESRDLYFRGTQSMARPERVELPTFWFVAKRSIQLSYGRAGTAHAVQIDYDTPPATSTSRVPNNSPTQIAPRHEPQSDSASLRLCVFASLLPFSQESRQYSLPRTVHPIVMPP
jgi:hypothetical protein